MPDKAKKTIDPLTRVPLHVEIYFNETHISDATGFVCTHNSISYFVTNWHVVSGKHPVNNKILSPTLALPNLIKIWYHSRMKLGQWFRVQEPLYESNEKPRWIEHPLGKEVDVIALPIKVREDVEIYPLDTSLSQEDLILTPSEPASIIGFPRGIASYGKFPIWKTAHIASDLDLDVNQRPTFVVDTTTKPGMSGSPVFARRFGAVLTSKGIRLGGGQTTRFLGIYSGRIDDDGAGDKDMYNLGVVWKPIVLEGIFNK